MERFLNRVIENNLQREIKYSSKKADWIKYNFDVFSEDIHRRLPIFHSLKSKYDFHGKILEIGAGSCWLSALLSKIPAVRKVYALDISKDLLEMAQRNIINRLNGDKSKIEFINADFNSLPFKDNEFDIIVCDASLHHSSDPALLAKEIGRVLRNDGFLIAVREPIKPILYFRNFGKNEIAKGATENIYSKKEWKKYFKEARMTLSIIESFSQEDFKTNLFKVFPFRLLNGVLFSRYYFYASKFKN